MSFSVRCAGTVGHLCSSSLLGLPYWNAVVCSCPLYFLRQYCFTRVLSFPCLFGKRICCMMPWSKGEEERERVSWSSGKGSSWQQDQGNYYWQEDTLEWILYWLPQAKIGRSHYLLKITSRFYVKPWRPKACFRLQFIKTKACGNGNHYWMLEK